MKLSIEEKSLLSRAIARYFALEGARMPQEQRLALDSVVKRLCADEAPKKEAKAKKAAPKKKANKAE